MRRGDQALQQLLTDPGRLSELRRLTKVPDEAPVWFIIAHVGMARTEAEREGRLLRLKLKHGGQGWSVARETADVVAHRPPKDQLAELRRLQREKRHQQQPAVPSLPSPG